MGADRAICKAVVSVHWCHAADRYYGGHAYIGGVIVVKASAVFMKSGKTQTKYTARSTSPLNISVALSVRSPRQCFMRLRISSVFNREYEG